MYENRTQKLILRALFVRGMVRHGVAAAAIVAGSLLMGTLGYHLLESQAWLDALVNAAMLLGGMGPIGELHTNAGKLFASFYALYCGIVFLAVSGVLLAPVFHRFMHRFHLGDDDAGN